MNHSDVVRGEEAHRLLESAIFKEAVQDVKDEITRQWYVAETIQEREELHSRQRALASITGALKKIADNGRFAADRLNKLERKQNG